MPKPRACSGSWAVLAELAAVLLAALPAQGAVLARAEGPRHLGDGGREAATDPRVAGLPLAGPDFELAFELKKAVRGVKVRLDKVEGLQRSDESAPGVFMDELLLGPIRREHDGGRWDSPFVLDLGPGRHRLRLQSWPKDADDFVWQGLTVYTGGLSKQASPPAGAARAEPAPSAGNGCGPGDSLPWPARLGGRSLALSVLSGREASSGELASLSPGTRFLARFKVPRSPESQAQPPLLLHAQEQAGQLLLSFQIDQAALGKPNAPLGYEPGQWNALELDWCDPGGVLRLKVGEFGMELRPLPEAKSLEVRVQDIELALDRRR